MCKKYLFLVLGFLSAVVFGNFLVADAEIQFAENSMNRAYRPEILERQNQYYSSVNEDFKETLSKFNMIVGMLDNSGEDTEQLEGYSRLMDLYMSEYEEDSEDDPAAAVELYELKIKPLKALIEARMKLYGFSIVEDNSAYFVDSLGIDDSRLEDFFEGKPTWLQEKLFDKLYESGSTSNLEYLYELSQESGADLSKFVDRMTYPDSEKVEQLMEQKSEQLEALNFILNSFDGSEDEKDKLSLLIAEMSEYVFPASMGEEVDEFIAVFAEELNEEEFYRAYLYAYQEFAALKEQAVAAKIEEGLIPFKDVDEEDWFASYVQEIKEQGIVGGYEDGTYQSENSVTVAELLKMVMELSGDGKSDSTSQNPYVHGNWAEGYFARAEEMGLTLTSTFDLDPARSATRLEAVRLLLEVGGFDVSAANEVEFYDVEFGSEDAKYIQFAADIGFISGDPEGTFRPNDSINRAEIAKVVSNFNDFFKSLERAGQIDEEI